MVVFVLIDKVYRGEGYDVPVIICKVSIDLPLSTYNLHNIHSYCNPDNVYAPITQAMQPIFNDWNQDKQIDFKLIENLFSILIKEGFSKEEKINTKIKLFLSLCEHAYNNFNNYTYPETSRTPIEIIGGGNSVHLSAGMTIFFDLGPKDQQTIPIKLINDILTIDAEQ